MVCDDAPDHHDPAAYGEVAKRVFDLCAFQMYEDTWFWRAGLTKTSKKTG